MIGDQIRQAREQRKLSQQEAARLAGLSRKQLSKLENDQGVTLETFRRVVTALEIPVVTFDRAKVFPGVDVGELLASARKTLAELQNLVEILDASAKLSSERTADDVLAAAAAHVPEPITEDHPTVQMLHQLIDDLAKSKSTRAGS